MIYVIILSVFLNSTNLINPVQDEVAKQYILELADSLWKTKNYKALIALKNENTIGELDPIEKMDLYFLFGEGHRKLYDFDSALNYYTKSLELSVILNDLNKQSKVLDKIGSNYRQSGQNYVALGYYLKSLKIKEEEGDNSGFGHYDIALSNEYLGLTYYLLSKDSLAVPHYRLAIEYYDKADNQPRKLASINNLGLSYSHWAQEIRRKPYLFGENEELRLDLLNKALDSFYELKRSNPKSKRLSNLYQNLSVIHLELNNWDSAYIYLTYCKKMRESSKNPDLSYTYSSLAFLFDEVENYDSADYYYTKSFMIKKQLEESGHKNLDDLWLGLYSNYSIHFESLNQYDSAYYYYKEFYSLNRKSINEKANSQIQELLIINETEKKEKEIAEQKIMINEAEVERSQLLTFIALAAIISGSAFVIFIFRQRSMKIVAEKNELLHVQEVSRLLKDHELKSIEAMLEGQEIERKRMAEDLHDRLGSTLAAAKLHFEAVTTPEKSEKALELLDKAISDTRDIAHNVLSGVLSKFGLLAALEDLKDTIEATNKLKIKISTRQFDGRIDLDKEINVYRIVQESVSNTLKHAHADEMKILLKRENGSLNVLIIDNGKGFSQNKTTQGVGLKNIEARVSKMGGHQSVYSKPGSGTKVEVRIPI